MTLKGPFQLKPVMNVHWIRVKVRWALTEIQFPSAHAYSCRGSAQKQTPFEQWIATVAVGWGISCAHLIHHNCVPSALLLHLCSTAPVQFQLHLIASLMQSFPPVSLMQLLPSLCPFHLKLKKSNLKEFQNRNRTLTVQLFLTFSHCGILVYISWFSEQLFQTFSYGG